MSIPSSNIPSSCQAHDMLAVLAAKEGHVAILDAAVILTKSAVAEANAEVTRLESMLARSESQRQELRETVERVEKMEQVVKVRDKELLDKDSILRELEEKLGKATAERDLAERAKMQLKRQITHLKDTATRQPLRQASSTHCQGSC
ncbi:hypothetical protein B0H17DRAFT_1210130 [Mycena rosella]|uniref:Uncharacterized protein n=1 Tax=Mycena rosella TaxID=1033263 RepID=A0AAD7CWR9_MYCRO|nr:hypothetical protein B0H17DRAFT_1210130 [Mycena rosella]